jgi:hypothetical protein
MFTSDKNNWRKFKGKCFNCGKIGHRSVECRTREGGTTPTSKTRTGFPGECTYCGKTGHKEKYCFKKKREVGEDKATIHIDK